MVPIVRFFVLPSNKIHFSFYNFNSSARCCAIRLCSNINIESAASVEMKLYFMEMNIESEPRRVAFSYHDSYASERRECPSITMILRPLAPRSPHLLAP